MFPLLLQLFTTAAFIATTLFNFTLCCLIRQRNARVGNYRRFFICSIVFDEAYSLSEWIISPFYYTDRGISVIIAVSFIETVHPWIEVFFFVWMSLFLNIIILVTHSFLYRYAIVTRSRLLRFYDNPLYAAPIAVCSMLFGVVVTAMIFSIFYPRGARCCKEVIQLLSIDANIKDWMMMGFDTHMSGILIAGVTTIVSAVIVFSICFFIIIYCGMQINRMTKSASISVRSRSNQKRMLHMLVFQTLNPVITVYLPSFYRVVTLVIQIRNSEEIHWILSFLYALFPVFNPLIVICCVQDYRMRLLRIVGWFESISMSSVVVKSQQLAVHANRVFSLLEMLPFCLQVFTTAAFITTTLLNAILACLLRRRTTRIGNYRRFFICSIVFDEAYSLSEWMASPFYYTDHGMAVGVAVFFLKTVHPWVEVFYFIWQSLFLDIIILVTHSFLYRYAIVTRSRLLCFYENPLYAVPIGACSMLFGFLFSTIIFSAFYPISTRYRYSLVRKLSKEAMIKDRFLIGFDTEMSGTLIAGITTVVSIAALNSFCCFIIIVFGMRINRMTKSASISERSRSNQKRMLHMLVFQTLNPVIIVYLPTFYRVITLLFSMTNPEEIHWILSFSYALFPVFNPLIVICCVQDYRMRLLRIVGWVEFSTVSSVVVKNQQFTRQICSIILNTFLLQLIVRKSSKELGLYKFLLFIFILNDIVYTVVHFITFPVVAIAGDIFYMFSTTLPERWVICVFATVHSHSYFILCFHFVYRHISVTKNDALHLFRQCRVISLLIFIFAAESIFWFTLIYIFYASDWDTFLELYSQLQAEYPYLHVNSAATAHYWMSDGSLRLRPLIWTMIASVVMCSVLAVVVYCAIRIYVVLHNTLSLSKRGLALQRQLYYTLLVQFSVPFCLMYIPVIFAIFPTLFRIRITLPGSLIPVMFSVFPSLDALVILFGVHDYRVATRKLLGCFKPKSAAISAVSAMTTVSIR